ncbi:MAG: hypothetical protein FWC47_06665 [Oscillospiraceae bacterium]|nr:hypothetical protein [Oscillospiraceae bacterium]
MRKFKDITNERFGRLVAIRMTDKRSKDNNIIWECVCDCGNVVEVPSTYLRKGYTKSCGCLHRDIAAQNGKKSIKDLTGKRFGRLVAINLTDKRNRSFAVWECKCDCGKVVEVTSGRLLNGHAKSCGCLQREIASEIGKKSMIDLTGQRYGSLVAIRSTDKHKNNSIVWECKCDCGNMVEASSTDLRRGRKKSCGCLNLNDITGQRFGRLVAICKTDKRKNGSTIWECKCDCGNVVEVPATYLRSGSSKSCGCLQRDAVAQTGQNNNRDVTGQKFGRLLAIRSTNKRSNAGSVIWECICDCGNKIEIPLVYLVSDRSDIEKSCGCLTHERFVEIGKNMDLKKQFGLVENTSVSSIKSQKISKASTTGHRGVCWAKSIGKYMAYIGFQKKLYNLGQFDNLEDAVKARQKAEDDIYKPFLEWYEENYGNNS